MNSACSPVRIPDASIELEQSGRGALATA
jgi:hypothetical protein